MKKPEFINDMLDLSVWNRVVHWYHQKGRFVVWGLLGLLVLMLVIMMFRAIQANRIYRDSLVYYGVLNQISSHDIEGAKASLPRLKEGTKGYALMADLIEGRILFDEGDYQAAEANFRLVLEGSKEPLLQSISAVSLATVIWKQDSSRFPEIESILAGIDNIVVKELLADILLEQEKVDVHQAIRLYQEAFEMSENMGLKGANNRLKLKLNYAQGLSLSGSSFDSKEMN